MSITVTDDDGGATTGSKIVTVDNVAPTVAVSGASPVNEGQTAVIHVHHDRPRHDTFSAARPSCGASGSYVPDSLVFSSVT